MVKVKAEVRRGKIEGRRQKAEDRRQRAKQKSANFLPFFVILLTSVWVVGEQSVKAEVPKGTEGIWDPNKYIGLDEIKPGMQAYCLTEYGLAGIEKFGVEVVDVVRNIEPGRDAILVKGTDERFIQTGPVAGCSGSPVYIEGRLAGALAFAFEYSKDPLYGATPIGEMLAVGRGLTNKGSSGGGSDSGRTSGWAGFGFDFSRPINFAEIDRRITAPPFARNNRPAGAATLPCPLITSGLPAQVCEQLNAFVEPLGLMVVSGVGGGIDNKAGSEQGGGGSEKQQVKLVPGACLAIPLVSGDITMGVYGTVTEVVGDKVYGFGHSFLGYGPVDLPIATGKVHTVMSSVLRSFKLASVVETVGALTIDEGAAVFGQIGAKARTFPLTIRVERYNDSEKRVYNCQVANNRVFTPSLVRSSVAGAAFYLGDFPPDHMIEYKVAISADGAEPITFENVSTGFGLSEMLIESAGSVALLMNNPYKEVDIKSVDCDVRIVPKSITSHIWSVDLSDSEVKAGEEIEVGVVVESVLAGKKRYQFRLKIPKDLAPGKYELTVCGAQDYEQFLRKAVPYRFIAQNLPGLVEAINNALRIDRGRLYCVLTLPPGGVAVEEAELPDLPATKALVLQSAKRVMRTQPYQHWLENSLGTGTIIIDKKVLQIIVEE
jgi:hypothetical protein